MNEAKQVSLIETTLTRRGSGHDESPIRVITQWWDADGVLVVEHDPASMVLTPEVQQRIKDRLRDAFEKPEHGNSAVIALLEVLKEAENDNRLRVRDWQGSQL